MKVETFECPLGGVTLHAVAMGKEPLADASAMVETANGMRESFEAGFKSLKVPTLLIRGAESKFISPEVWALTKAQRPDMRAIELAHADHYAAEQIPGPIAEEILSFWRRDVRPAAPG